MPARVKSVPEVSNSRLGSIDWFDDLIVVEATIGLSAPLTGRVFAELGAEVIKVESEHKLDVNRIRLPRESDPPDFPNRESFSLLHEGNSSKKSVRLNLKSEVGLELFVRLLKHADVFIQNFVPGWLERLGLSIEALMEANPGLIVLSAAGYGQEGPLRTQRSYAPVMTSLAGFDGLVGYSDGNVVGTMALALADLHSAYYGAYLVMAALSGLSEDHRGCHIDLSQIEATTTLVGEAMIEWQRTGTAPGPHGNRGPKGIEWRLIRCQGKDSWVAAALPENIPKGLIEGDQLLQNREVLVERLQALGIECIPVLSIEEVRTDLDFAAHGLFQQMPHPLIGSVSTTGIPWHLDEVVPKATGPAPIFGANTREVITGLLGVSDHDYATYKSLGAFE